METELPWRVSLAGVSLTEAVDSPKHSARRVLLRELVLRAQRLPGLAVPLAQEQQGPEQLGPESLGPESLGPESLGPEPIAAKALLALQVSQPVPQVELLAVVALQRELSELVPQVAERWVQPA